MDKPTSQPSIPRLSPGCPFLGLKEDSETHFSTPSLGNYCHKVDPSEPVNFDHQDRFCLSDHYSHCVVYSNQWQGLLPDTIRGDGAPGNRLSTQQKMVVGAQLIPDEEDEIENDQVKDDQIDIPVSNKQMAFEEIPNTRSDIQTSDEMSENLPWKRLHEEARSRYLETKPNRREKFLWAGLIIVASIIFLVSIWGLFNRFSELQTQAELSMLSARTLTAIIADEQLKLAEAATATERAAILILENESTPTPIIEEAETDPLLSEALTATAQYEIESQAASDVCSDLSGYPIEIISGPHLTPRPGYIYQPGSPEPVILASWIIKNPGTCIWEQIVLQDVTTGENIVPFLKRDGVEIDLTDLEQAINPEDDVEIAIGFKLKDAETINREWLLLVNGFNLFDQSHIILKIDDWIIVQQATATPTKEIKPTSKPGGPSGKPTSTSPRVTEKPPTRSP